MVGSAKTRDLVDCEQHLDTSSHAWATSNEAAGLQLDNHTMDARGRDAEEGLHVGLGRGSAVQEIVGVDEREVLPLLVGEFRHEGIDRATMD